jgi:hypothetical protein
MDLLVPSSSVVVPTLMTEVSIPLAPLSLLKKTRRLHLGGEVMVRER